jgi:hypothetical protein
MEEEELSTLLLTPLRTEEDMLRCLKNAILSLLTDKHVEEAIRSVEFDGLDSTLIEIDRENTMVTDDSLGNMLWKEVIGEPGEGTQWGMSSLDYTKSIMNNIEDKLPKEMWIIHASDSSDIRLIVELKVKSWRTFL